MEFNKFGHPGNLKSSTLVNGGDTLHCTGSMYGVGAVIKVGNYDGNITLSDGGVVSGTHLLEGVGAGVGAGVGPGVGVGAGRQPLQSGNASSQSFEFTGAPLAPTS